MKWNSIIKSVIIILICLFVTLLLIELNNRVIENKSNRNECFNNEFWNRIDSIEPAFIEFLKANDLYVKNNKGESLRNLFSYSYNKSELELKEIKWEREGFEFYRDHMNEIWLQDTMEVIYYEGDMVEKKVKEIRYNLRRDGQYYSCLEETKRYYPKPIQSYIEGKGWLDNSTTTHRNEFSRNLFKFDDEIDYGSQIITRLAICDFFIHYNPPSNFEGPKRMEKDND